MTMEQKQAMLAHMRDANSLKFTLCVQQALYSELIDEVGALEHDFGVNHEFRLLSALLKV
jgi:hypothetical protein